MFKIGDRFKILATFTTLSFMVASGLPTFVMQAVNCYHVSHSVAGSLESYTTLTQILASFVMFSVLLKLGYRRSVVVGCSLLLVACLLLPFLNDIWALRLYLMVTGLVFVALKIVCYSSVGLVVREEKEHASFINLMEAFFTLGTIVGMWIYSYFVDRFAENWIRVFWVFGAVCWVLILMWVLTPFDEHALHKQEEKSLKSQFQDGLQILGMTTLIFVVLVFAYESLEQGVGSWLPTFYSEILKLPPGLCIQMGSMFTVGLVIGRFIGAYALQKVAWHRLFLVNFILGTILLVVVMTNIQEGIGVHSNSILNTPWVAFGIPMVGIFIGPVYPTLMSRILESHPQPLQPAMMSLSMVATPLADSVSSKILGVMFGSLGGIKAFAVATLVPMIAILLLIYPFRRHLLRNHEMMKANQK